MVHNKDMSRFLKLLILLALSLAVIQSVYAKDKNDLILQCSYITAQTDFYIKLRPITFKSNGDAYMDNKIVGKAYKTDDNTLFLPMEKDTLLSINFDKWESIYSFMLNGKPVYNFGSCELK